MPRHWHARAAALLALGALAVHQGRYLLAYGDGAGQTLARQGHGYLAAVTPLIVAALAVAVFAFVRAVVVARRTGAGERAERSFGVLWPAASAALAGAFAAQEWLEGTLAAGHPAGLAGVVGHGGWTALPLAVAAGALIALALRGAARVIARAAAAYGTPPRPSAPSVLRAPRSRFVRAPGGLARHLAGRAPPLLSCR